MRKALSEWFEPRRSAYPWRNPRPDPYAVLVSEVMLQQTQAARVVRPYRAFLARFPDLGALAESSRADVVRAWAGLGYNRRAVALHEAARAIVARHAGEVPRDTTSLEALPGVGPYTAAAVASIAFGEPTPALDTNARRVIARACVGHEPEELATREIRAAAAQWIDPMDPGAWNAAIMDLGRELCRRRDPSCHACPLRRGCNFRRCGRLAGSVARRQTPYPGSSRKLRGDIVRLLRARGSASLGELEEATEGSGTRVREAVRGLVADGLLEMEGDRPRLPA